MSRHGLIAAITLAAGISAVALPSYATVITFDADPNIAKVNNLLNFLGNTVTEQGYTFTDTNNFGSYGLLSQNFAGKFTLFDNQVSAPTTLTLTLAGGGTFDFNKIDIANADQAGQLAGITFTGLIHGGGTVSHTFTTADILATGAGYKQLGTLDLTSFGFDNLDSVTWLEPNGTTPLFAWTDVDVTQDAEPVAEPAALIVFGTAMLAYGLLRRRARRGLSRPALDMLFVKHVA
jgi:hypothetical protein